MIIILNTQSCLFQSHRTIVVQARIIGTVIRQQRMFGAWWESVSIEEANSISIYIKQQSLSG